MLTKREEIANDIFDMIEDEENAAEIVRDLVAGVEPTRELKSMVDSAAEAARIDPDGVWKMIMDLAKDYVAALDRELNGPNETDRALIDSVFSACAESAIKHAPGR